MTDIIVDLRAENGIDFTSDSLDVVGYDRESKTLYVEFQSSGTVYAYEGVEESTFNLFINADSLNRFWRDHISGTYTKGVDSNGVITPREQEDPATTTQAEYEPLVPVGDPWGVATPQATVSAGITFTNAEGDVSINIPNARINIPKRRFGIRWEIPGTALSSEPVYEANTVDEALKDFASDAETFLGPDVQVKVKAVVHYLD